MHEGNGVAVARLTGPMITQAGEKVNEKNMKSFYFVFSATLDGKNYAGTINKTSQDNILCLYQQIPNLTAVHICESKEKAEEIADMWNESFKKNGTVDSLTHICSLHDFCSSGQ